MSIYPPLDPVQLVRIEAVHRGFLYQHLYAAGCLLLAGQCGVRSVTVEMDEDVEVEYENGDRLYVQVKTRSSPLTQSDISGAFDRFERIRLEHEGGRRTGSAEFVVVANVAPGPELLALANSKGLPAGAMLLTPGTTTAPAACLPPAWVDFTEAVGWCAERARALPMTTLDPETLVWKLAGRIPLAAAGQAPGHTFLSGDLPTLFEQLVIQLQQFPAPPDVYRPLQDEPALDGTRIRIVSGFSGAGKTAWAAQMALYLGSECAYFDVGDVPGPAIAASLVRELAAHWAASTVDGLRQVLLPGATGIEALRALDRFLGNQRAHAMVVLDNAHRVPADDLRMLIEATRNLRLVLLAQPSSSIAELETGTGLRQEMLRGWDLDQTAAEAHARGVRASAATLGKIVALTGGLPLYVRAAVQLCADQYGGNAAAMCASVEAHSNLVETAQHLILSRSFDALSPSVRDCVAVLSLSDVPISQAEAARLVEAAYGLDGVALAATVRQLRPLGVVRVYAEQRLQIHDAYRVLGLRRLANLAPQQAEAGRRALKELILESFERERDASRFPLLIRTLVELNELKTLVDVATEEWFHELGIDSGIWAALDAAAQDEAIDAEQRFYALDGLVFADMKAGHVDKIDSRLTAMEALVTDHGLGAHEELVLQLKRMTFKAELGDEAAARGALAWASALAPSRSELQRIIRYNFAHALLKLGRHAEAEAIARQLVEEYFSHLGLTPDGILGQSSRKLADMLAPTPTLHDDLKHLADSLDIVARATNAQGRDAVFARIHAAKFYKLANALDSYVNVSQDLVDEFLGRGDVIGARQVIEETLLPVVLEHQMLGKLVQVRSQYAVVLGYCGDHDAASKELERIAPYRAGLAAEQQAELDNQRKLVTYLAVKQWLSG